MESELSSLRDRTISVGLATLTLLNHLARARNADEAHRLAASLRAEAVELAPEVGELIDALEERAVALELQQKLAGRDELTGVANRRGFNETLHREAARARRSGKSLSLLMLDMDGLKQVNDRYGHPTGDAAIRAVAQATLVAVREGDQVFRLGGDEFAVLLPGAEGDEAAIVGERIRRKLQEHPVRGLIIEVSYGHARLRAADSDGQALMDQADRALYRNKRARRRY